MRRARLSVGLALTASLMAAGLIAAPPAAAAPKCFGKAATIVGTAGPDDLFGTPREDVIVGLGGRDLLVGSSGDDRICGGKAADEIYGGGGEDKIDGEAGQDIGVGMGGADLVIGGSGFDFLLGGASKDTLKGRGDFDVLFGGGANDKLLGGGFFDVLIGEGGDDLHDGGPGEDMASFAFSRNKAGIDASLATGVATGEGTDTLTNVEGLEGSFRVAAPDRFTGNARHNFFRPLGGDDVVAGGGADDILILALSEAPVTVDLEAQTATGEGNDALTSIEMATGSQAFGDSLTGSNGANWLFGLDGDDSIIALDGDDFLDGGNGTDTGDGGPGFDECVSIETVIDGSCELPAPSAPSRPQGTDGGGRAVPIWATLGPTVRPSH